MDRLGEGVPSVLATGDGALGFWKALREVFPETREQRRRVPRRAPAMTDGIAY